MSAVRVEGCVVDNVVLPDTRFEGLWESIVTPTDVKERLLHHTLLAIELRRKLPFSATAVHGLVLLFGPPGTGKTTLARGLPSELTKYVGTNQARLVEINPHGLMSAEHGRSQQAVSQLMTEHIPELAADGLPTVVLLDEVESMAVARSEASLAANPADVHRATDAVLAALDRNAAEHPHIVVVATSNFVSALDEAFQSRADVVLEMPRPDARAIELILGQTLDGFSAAYPKLSQLGTSSQLAELAQTLAGADARRVRKVVTDALARRVETVINPDALTFDDLKAAARDVGEGLGAQQ